MNLLNLTGWEVVSVKETKHDYRVADIGSMLADSEDARLLEDAQRHRPDSTQTLKFRKHDE
jgi:hypothetical protein